MQANALVEQPRAGVRAHAGTDSPSPPPAALFLQACAVRIMHVVARRRPATRTRPAGGIIDTTDGLAISRHARVNERTQRSRCVVTPAASCPAHPGRVPVKAKPSKVDSACRTRMSMAIRGAPCRALGDGRSGAGGLVRSLGPRHCTRGRRAFTSLARPYVAALSCRSGCLAIHPAGAPPTHHQLLPFSLSGCGARRGVTIIDADGRLPCFNTPRPPLLPPVSFFPRDRALQIHRRR